MSADLDAVEVLVRQYLHHAQRRLHRAHFTGSQGSYDNEQGKVTAYRVVLDMIAQQRNSVQGDANG